MSEQKRFKFDLNNLAQSIVNHARREFLSEPEAAYEQYLKEEEEQIARLQYAQVQEREDEELAALITSSLRIGTGLSSTMPCPICSTGTLQFSPTTITCNHCPTALTSFINPTPAALEARMRAILEWHQEQCALPGRITLDDENNKVWVLHCTACETLVKI